MLKKKETCTINLLVIYEAKERNGSLYKQMKEKSQWNSAEKWYREAKENKNWDDAI